MKFRNVVLILITCLLCCSCSGKKHEHELNCYDYKKTVCDGVVAGVSESFECVSVICHLAGFEEYCEEDVDSTVYDEYFLQFKKCREVKNAIKTYRKYRAKYRFCYDVPATFATYLTPDCHGFRCDYEIVQEVMKDDVKNIKKLLDVTADFFDATNFDSFYKSQFASYDKTIEFFEMNCEDMMAGKAALEEYYKIKTDEIFVSNYVLIGNSNYGTSYRDGEKFCFEPKYAHEYYDPAVFVHELSHPYSNPVAEELWKNEEIKDFFTKEFTGLLKKRMEAQAYSIPYLYFMETLNRANVISLLENESNESLMRTLKIQERKWYGFPHVDLVVDTLKEFKNGNFSSFMDYKDEFEKKLVENLKNVKAPTESAAEDMVISINGKEYNALYMGKMNLKGLGDYVERKYWKIENCDELKGYEQFYDNYLPYNNFPFRIEAGEIYRLEYVMTDGSIEEEYYRADGLYYYDEICCALVY